jgi:deoxyribose-phosphate aldolase
MSEASKMTLGPTDLAKMIDISAVRVFNSADDVQRLARIARENQFAAAHALPHFVPILVSELTNSETKVGAPIGFPSGGSTTKTKIAEAMELKHLGVEEADLMVNVGRLLSGDMGYLVEEIRSLVTAIAPVPIKVILEVHYLSESQIKQGCEACIEAGAAFVKTGTGWAPSGATLKNIGLITRFVNGAIKVKASGGIRDFLTALKMWEMGVDRFGINTQSAMAILEECAGAAAEKTSTNE